MAQSKPPPELPPGTSSTLRGISENLSFHSSPETFITDRVIQFQKEHPELISSRSIVRAKILNRNVAVVSSYAQVTEVLNDPGYVARDAYDELMSAFFPSPNLLLADGEAHRGMRESWEKRMADLPGQVEGLTEKITRDFFDGTSSETGVDLYDTMKRLSWKLLLGIFLGIPDGEPEFEKIESLHEDLLRGQFTLMPVSINTGFWKSPRTKGKSAKDQLKTLIQERLSSPATAMSCPFMSDGESRKEDIEDVANHTLLYTTSLAVKALASLLTAFMLNVFLYPNLETRGFGLAEKYNKLRASDPKAAEELLVSILFETERLSPPIVGIMRRAASENTIASLKGQADVLIPKGWDVWLYFVGAGRDPATFGDTWGHFDPERYIKQPDLPQAFAFGGGPKRCLGQYLVRAVVLKVVKTALDMCVKLSGGVATRGVRGWLGWEENDTVSPKDWAADMKQLPTQRPAEPVHVRISMPNDWHDM